MADIKIFGKLVNATTDNIIVGTDQTYDSTQKKQQSTINAEVKDALAGKMNASPIVLTNQDLNTIQTPGVYSAAGSNSVTNKPTTVDSFGLDVYKVASGYVAQELTSGSQVEGSVYYRQFNGSGWSEWMPKASVFLANPTPDQVLTSDATGRLKSSGFTVKTSVPAGAKFTDTTYNPVTTTTNGLMSSTDKTKLDGIQEGANKITVGGNITNSNGTISITKKNVTDALGFIPSGATYGQVTESEDGLMIAADKIKLNGIEEGAQKNTVTSVAGRTGAVVLTKSDVGLSNVDNTSDLNKPVSTATQTALDKKIGKINVTGSGNAVTEASILEGGTLTLTKGATYNNYTHPEKHPWDILSNPPATATRWPNAMELTSPTVSYTNGLPAALVPYIPKAGTNMFAGAKASDEITVERSTNNGTSWSDVTTEEASNIRAVFSGVIDGNILVSKASDKNSAIGHQLRITFDPKDRYCMLSFIFIWGSTNGGECKLDIEYNTKDNKTKWTKIISDIVPSGWSGPTIIGMGGHFFSQPNTATSPWGLRFTFKQTKVSDEYSSIQTINSIQGFSTSIAWGSVNNPICKSGTPYLIKDADLTTNFPGVLQCKDQEVFHKGNLSWNTLPGKPSSLPASDVHPWAKAENKPTYTKDEISGLNDVLGSKVSKVNVTGSGNAITEASISEGGTLTLTKGATYNNYSLPLATADVRGGVKIGFTQTGKKYPVQLEAEKMFVEVPWTDTNTTYTAGENLTLSGNSFALNQTISLTRVNASGGFYQTSDKRLKSDIKPLEHTLDDICSIPTDSFILSGKKDFGTIAQSVESKFPELVTDAELKHSDVPNPENFDTVEKNGETYVLVKEVDYAKMSILAIEGIKLLRKEIEDLKKQLSEKK